MRWFVLAIGLVACKKPPARPRLLLHEDGVENAYPRLSRDGSQVLYQTNRSGHWQLAVLDVASGTSRPVMTTPSNETLPDWSPDGSQLAWVSDRDGNEEIYVADADGANARRITVNPGRDIHPYWSPDGMALLINSVRVPADNLDVYRIELASLEATRITSAPEDETCARYTPDASRIVMLKNDARSDDVVELDVTTGAIPDVTRTPAVRDGWPVFGPDGVTIYYASMANGPFSIYKQGPSGPPVQLTFAAPGEEDARPFVSADGTQLVYNKRAGGAIDILVTAP
jgi:Tol biopolymer transport system component